MRRRWLLAPAMILAGSQLGHLLAYQARLGPQALDRQSQAAHFYLPTLAGAAAALAGGAAVTVILAVAGARLLAGRRRRLPAGPGPGWLDLFAVIFTLQLAAYFAQETLEAGLAGGPLAPAPDLLLWGALGQLPAAAAAALALSWLSVRFEAAVAELELGAGEPEPLRVRLPLAAAPCWDYAGQPLLTSAPTVFIKRGPPLTSR